jgi:hypothetical protein
MIEGRGKRGENATARIEKELPPSLDLGRRLGNKSILSADNRSLREDRGDLKYQANPVP